MSTAADHPVSAHALRRGVVFGVATGAAACIVLYLVVLGTTSMQSYLLPGFGIAIAFGVYHGMLHPGRRAAVVSLLITAVSLVLALYFVERHLLIVWFTSNGDTLHIPLVPYLDWVAEVVGHALGQSPSTSIYAILALIAAGWFGHQGFDSHDPQRRPS